MLENFTLPKKYWVKGKSKKFRNRLTQEGFLAFAQGWPYVKKHDSLYNQLRRKLDYQLKLS